MTTGQLLIIAAGLVTGLVTAVLARPVLRWLPEPPGPDGPDYAALATAPHLVLACALGSAVAAAVSWAALPPAVQPLWSVLAVGGVLLAGIDAATTWLPLRLVQVTWAAMAVAALVGASLAGTGVLLLRAGVGAAVAGGLYLLVWLVSRGGFGFGDVRYAPLLGAATAAVGWPLLVHALFAGTLVGALLGLLRLVRRRREAFAYAPAMLVGCYLAALADWLV